ncbi:hypothetical protein RHMOL_Rhmol10G0151900 [Rhododendron molle]|uniref:Uncharacterized protein n=1 Tax=Rhododendron molle TaxID=49168 RepID=A0ACC0M3G5_RHOML|nr:hypothetical protein RHMOL_Rhmol10G0151900 [Rhododendron molle]
MDYPGACAISTTQMAQAIWMLTLFSPVFSILPPHFCTGNFAAPQTHAVSWLDLGVPQDACYIMSVRLGIPHKSPPPPPPCTFSLLCYTGLWFFASSAAVCSKDRVCPAPHHLGGPGVSPNRGSLICWLCKAFSVDCSFVFLRTAGLITMGMVVHVPFLRWDIIRNPSTVSSRVALYVLETAQGEWVSVALTVHGADKGFIYQPFAQFIEEYQDVLNLGHKFETHLKHIFKMLTLEQMVIRMAARTWTIPIQGLHLNIGAFNKFTASLNSQFLNHIMAVMLPTVEFHVNLRFFNVKRPMGYAFCIHDQWVSKKGLYL